MREHPQQTPESLRMVRGAMVAAIRGDGRGVRSAVGLIPGSELRGALVATVEVFVGVLLERALQAGDTTKTREELVAAVLEGWSSDG